MVKISLIKWGQCVRIGLSAGSKKSKSTREDTTKRRATQNTRRSRVCVWGRWDPPFRRDRCVWFISHSCIGRHRNQLPGVLSLSNTVKASPSLTSLPGYFKLYKTFICLRVKQRIIAGTVIVFILVILLKKVNVTWLTCYAIL